MRSAASFLNLRCDQLKKIKIKSLTQRDRAATSEFLAVAVGIPSAAGLEVFAAPSDAAVEAAVRRVFLAPITFRAAALRVLAVHRDEP